MALGAVLLLRFVDCNGFVATVAVARATTTTTTTTTILERINIVLSRIAAHHNMHPKMNECRCTCPDLHRPHNEHILRSDTQTQRPRCIQSFEQQPDVAREVHFQTNRPTNRWRQVGMILAVVPAYFLDGGSMLTSHWSAPVLALFLFTLVWFVVLCWCRFWFRCCVMSLDLFES